MNIAVPRTNTRTPFPVLLERVNEMKPVFADAARDTEPNRRISVKTMKMLKEAEIHKVLKPAAYDGFEYGFREALTLGFEIARACGSTAWCASLTMSYPWMASNFSKEAQDEIWQDPDTIFC